MKSIFLKIKQFFKKNVYPITVTFCTVLVLGVIAISAYSAISNNPQEPSAPVVSDQSTGSGDGEKGDNVSTQGDPLEFALPFDGAKISKRYCENELIEDLTTKSWCTHQALDFSCVEGQEVKAVYDGVIEKIENTMMNGTVIYLKVSDNLTVVYKGLSGNVNVSEGQSVKKGDKIGKVTSFLTEKKDGVHLHLEVLKDKKAVDPTQYFDFKK